MAIIPQQEQNNHIYIAQKTLDAIEEAISRDQGAAYRGHLGRVIGHIGDAYSTDTFPFRSHMGASLIGGDCSRATWYGWRWFTRPKHSGRLLRLFNRGHLEEARFIAILLTIGCQVYQQDANGKQFRISHANGHFGGSSDGIVYNIPDLPGQYVLAEFKTHSLASFTKLQKAGVADSKPEHVIQMNIYMEKMNIPVGLYMAVCKDNDAIHAELIVANKDLAESHLDLGEYLIQLQTPPKKLNNSSGYYKCKWCDHRPVCHLGELPDLNCRTCKFSQTVDNGGWVCSFDGRVLDNVAQLNGCSKHIRIDQ